MIDKKFKDYGLSDEIMESIEKLGFLDPTDVQIEVIPIALEGRDIIVKSQTGSGKTAAFGIPICEKIDIEKKNPQALILAPTRELCVQIKDDITNIGRFKKIRCVSVFGKQPITTQVRELRQRVHIIVGTPGRTIDHIERGNIALDDIEYLVIDEADKMLEMGFIEQVAVIVNALPKKRVTMLFSATIPEQIQNLCRRYMINPTNIEITPENILPQDIAQVWYQIEEGKKSDLLNKIIYIEHPDSCIIFCRTKDNVERLYGQMKGMGYSCGELHGGMLQNDRLDIMQKFKSGEFAYLVATDIAARGIDVESLSHIINYDVPLEKESYVHRIGRTGRAGSTGKAVTFVNPNENKFLYAIENYIGCKIPKSQTPTEDEVDRAKKAFKGKLGRKPKPKADKSSQINDEITKIYINAGREKKVSAGDIVGAISKINGVNPDDIGIIDIQGNHSYIDILYGKGDIVLEALQTTPIKGKTVRAQKAVK